MSRIQSRKFLFRYAKMQVTVFKNFQGKVRYTWHTENLKPHECTTCNNAMRKRSLRNLIQLWRIMEMEFTLAFFREFARSTESKQTLTTGTTEILKSIVLPNTILSFPAGLIYGLIVATWGLSHCTFHSRLSTRRMNLPEVEGVTNLNFANCSNEHCLYMLLYRELFQFPNGLVIK